MTVTRTALHLQRNCTLAQKPAPHSHRDIHTCSTSLRSRAGQYPPRPPRFSLVSRPKSVYSLQPRAPRLHYLLLLLLLPLTWSYYYHSAIFLLLLILPSSPDTSQPLVEAFPLTQDLNLAVLLLKQPLGMGGDRPDLA